MVYTSNVFAILGLRALYFAVAGLIEHMRYLRYGLLLLYGRGRRQSQQASGS